MKLSFDTNEKKEGLIFKKNRWDLTVKFEFTSDEIALIKKHSWHKNLMCEWQPQGYNEPIKCTTESFMKGPKELVFYDIGELTQVKDKIVEQAKILKNNLEIVPDLTNGSEEIEL